MGIKATGISDVHGAATMIIPQVACSYGTGSYNWNKYVERCWLGYRWWIHFKTNYGNFWFNSLVYNQHLSFLSKCSSSSRRYNGNFIPIGHPSFHSLDPCFYSTKVLVRNRHCTWTTHFRRSTNKLTRWVSRTGTMNFNHEVRSLPGTTATSLCIL